MQSIDDLEVQGKVVLVRSDLNTPLETSPEGVVAITDDGRIRAALPTISDLAARGARVVVMSHLGRPKGQVVPGLSLQPVAVRLGELLHAPVAFSPTTVGEQAQGVVAGLADGQVALLENLRFTESETSKDDAERGAFADQLAQLADFYVGDGFGVSHRKHASVYDIALRLPHAAGRLIASEVSVLQRLTRGDERPYVVVLGGSKVSDKLGVIETFLGKADRILIGGGMVYTFLAAMGYGVGSSLLEPDLVEQCRGYIAQAQSVGVDLVLPTDIVVADRFASDADSTVVGVDAIPNDWMGLDIGPDSAQTFAGALSDAATVFWNGPMGVFEFDAFASGTRAVAQAMANSSAFTVVGGGDSAAAVRHLGFADDQFGYISTGGGASLEYLEGRELPGLSVLEDKA
ncbi:MAG: phosphoglycerate kinase [Actinobacteria bacterium]|uniref:phosphoglycerate kinase n=1 Tax=freshwater metagenome TaxID=449393 RepID=A0A6J6W7G0_9ZZZZ|nr:phosphoglycerate kinase [Actinomycetota bacterium]